MLLQMGQEGAVAEILSRVDSRQIGNAEGRQQLVNHGTRDVLLEGLAAFRGSQHGKIVVRRERALSGQQPDDRLAGLDAP